MILFFARFQALARQQGQAVINRSPRALRPAGDRRFKATRDLPAHSEVFTCPLDDNAGLGLT